MLVTTWMDYLVRNWALAAIAFTIVTLVVVPAIVLMKYIRIAVNIMRSTKPPLSRNPLDFERLAGEPVTFSAYDGQPLAGMLVRAPRDLPSRGLIVFSHEYCSDMHSCARYCRPLLDAGYDIFTFDYRGHGQSDAEPGYTPRQWVSDRELNDIRGAIAFALDWLAREGRPREIGVLGVSRGACSAILAAAETPEIMALLCDGAFSTDNCVEYFMKRWAYIFVKGRLFESYHPIFWRFMRWAMIAFAQREFGCTFPSVRKTLARMAPRPMAFVHGQKDSYLPIEQGRLLFALAPQPKTFWAAPGAKHNQAVVLHPDAYARLTTDFFGRYLAHAPVSEAPAVHHDAAAPRRAHGALTG